jgi:hypothetical protein
MTGCVKNTDAIVLYLREDIFSNYLKDLLHPRFICGLFECRIFSWSFAARTGPESSAVGSLFIH